MRRLLCAALMGTLALQGLATTSAEEVEQHLVDAHGDANFINGQGFQPGISQSTGPLQVPGADLRGIRFETVMNGPKVKEFHVHVTLDQPLASASPDMVFRTVANLGGCPSMFAANSSLVNGPNGYWRMTDAGACGYDPAKASALGTFDLRDGVKVESTPYGFVIRLVAAELPPHAAKMLKPGALIIDVNAHVRTIIVAVTAPVVDELVDKNFTSYKMGS